MGAAAVEQPVHPLTLIRDAVLAARADGIRVRIGGSWGVECVSSEGARRWERDQLAGAVDPLGAVILQHQPQATDPEAALGEVLNAPPPYVLGAIDGIEGEQPSRRQSTGVSRALYAAGYELGWTFREELLREGGRS